MSESNFKLDRKDFSCRVCGDLPREPVTIPCGHSFCRSCVHKHWDGEHEQPFCPQCGEKFTPRPSLCTNVMLETLVIQLKTLFSAEEKSKANPGHEESWTDTELARIRKDLEERRQKLQMKIEEKERQLAKLRRMSPDAALQRNNDTFTEAIELLKDKRSSTEQQIKSHKHIALFGLQLFQDQVKEDIDFWTKQKSEREGLIYRTRDTFQFMRKCNSLPVIPAPRQARQVNPEMTSFRKFVLNKPQIPMNLQTWCFFYEARLEDDAVTQKPRERFLKHWCKITFDPNTANKNVDLEPTAAGNPCALFTAQPKDDVPEHPERFTDCVQVLSKEPLAGQCYFEVCPSGGCFIGLTYKRIERKGKGNLCVLGLNDESWACFGGGFKVKNLGSGDTLILCPNVLNRIGVYLDHEAGTLTTYLMRGSGLCDIHVVETQFTEPLYFGVLFLYPGDRIWVPDRNDKLLC